MFTGKTVLRAAMSATFALAVLSAQQVAHAQNAPSLLLRGPVEFAPGGGVSLFGTVLPTAAGMTAGDEASVYGWLKEDGTVQIARVVRTGAYVPGASELVLSGVVSTASPAVAKATIGLLTLDYSGLLAANPGLTLQRGYFVRVAGTQPSPGGVLIAALPSDSIVALSEGALVVTATAAMNAPVVDSLTARGTNAGIIGTAKASADAGIIGTARNAGIIGTAKASADAGIIGTARNAGIIGTAKASTDAGIIGTAKATSGATGD